MGFFGEGDGDGVGVGKLEGGGELAGLGVGFVGVTAFHRARLNAILLISSHLLNPETRTYTPGKLGLAHSTPYDTIPISAGSPVESYWIIGPPESPELKCRLVSIRSLGIAVKCRRME